LTNQAQEKSALVFQVLLDSLFPLGLSDYGLVFQWLLASFLWLNISRVQQT